MRSYSSPPAERSAPRPPTPPPPPDLRFILSGDLCALLLGSLGSLADLAALELALEPHVPAELRRAVEARGAALIAHAPLRAACFDFEAVALWPARTAAANWHPRRFFAELRAPTFCQAAGGRCAHGLLQKREAPRAGVLELLERLAASERLGVGTLAIECRAWLFGALGRNDEAVRAWQRAAAAGSARAQLDIGLKLYRSGPSPSTVYYAADAPRPAAEPDDPNRTVQAMLRHAAAGGGPTAQAPLGWPCRLERAVIRAKASVHMGMIILDGEALAAQDEAAADHWFREALRGAADGEVHLRSPASGSDYRTSVLGMGDDEQEGVADWMLAAKEELREAAEGASGALDEMRASVRYRSP